MSDSESAPPPTTAPPGSFMDPVAMKQMREAMLKNRAAILAAEAAEKRRQQEELERNEKINEYQRKINDKNIRKQYRDMTMGGKATNWAKNKVKDKYHGFKERYAGDEGSLKLLFWLAVVIQLIDVMLLRFNRTSQYTFALGMYIILTLLAIYFFSRAGGHLVNPRQIMLFTLISAFYIIVPSLLYALDRFNVELASLTPYNWASFFLAILPIWPIYIGLKAKMDFVHKYVNLWILFILFVFLFGFGLKIGPAGIAGFGGMSQLIDAGPVFNYLWDEAKDAGKALWDSITNVIPNVINATGINYYTGMIDNSEEEPVGLYLSNARLADKYSYVGTPVVIWVDLKGKSFVDEMVVTTSCFDEKFGAGETEPKEFHILGLEHNTVSCTFPSLPKGSYTAQVKFSFDFETWAYMTYTFVDLELKRAMEMEGKNVNAELDIDPLPRSVYSSGPVMLGMGTSVDQPIGVDVKANSREPILGVTFDNLWTEGEAFGNTITILVPQDFKLIKCDRGTPEVESGGDSGYDNYTFSRSQLDPRQTFTSVTCRLQIVDPKQLVSGAQKVERTFVSIAKYNYVLKKSVSFSVKE